MTKKLPEFEKEKRQNISDELKRGGKSLQGTDLDGLATDLSGAGEGLANDDVEGAQNAAPRIQQKDAGSRTSQKTQPTAGKIALRM